MASLTVRTVTVCPLGPLGNRAVAATEAGLAEEIEGLKKSLVVGATRVENERCQ